MDNVVRGTPLLFVSSVAFFEMAPVVCREALEALANIPDPAPAASKKRKAGRPVGSGKDTGRDLNFNSWEDFAISSSFANTSSDPHRGVNQRGNQFWGRVHANYAELHSQTDIRIKLNPELRTKDQISNRFKAISREMNYFFGILRQIETEEPSGTPKEKYPDLAIERFVKIHKRQFKLKDCIEPLKPIVRYNEHGKPTLWAVLNEHLASSESEAERSAAPVDAASTNMASCVMGSHMSRPIGKKKACEAKEAARRLGLAATSTKKTPVHTPVHQLLKHSSELNLTLKKIHNFEVQSKMFEYFTQMKKKRAAKRVMQQMMECLDNAVDEDCEEGEDDDEEEEEEEEEESQPIGSSRRWRPAPVTTPQPTLKAGGAWGWDEGGVTVVSGPPPTSPVGRCCLELPPDEDSEEDEVAKGGSTPDCEILLSFSTQALMEADSAFTEARLPREGVTLTMSTSNSSTQSTLSSVVEAPPAPVVEASRQPTAVLPPPIDYHLEQQRLGASRRELDRGFHRLMEMKKVRRRHKWI